jgi:uncharacterized SAM-dependent methyltransferase
MARETIHTENSYKFTDPAVQRLLDQAGYEIGWAWKDSRDWYAVTLASVR